VDARSNKFGRGTLSLAFALFHPSGGTLKLVLNVSSSERRECVEIYEESTADSRLPVLCTGIKPLRWVQDQSSADGIIVNVLDGLPDRLDGGQVAVVASAGPPETIRDLLLSRRQQLEPFGLALPEIDQCSARDRLFDRSQNFRNGVHFSARVDDEMDMLRHEHIGPQVERLLGLAGAESIHEIVARSFAFQKRAIVKATEGQLMGIARRVAALASFAMGLSNLHGATISGRAPSKQV
jgi:hypothetical protein